MNSLVTAVCTQGHFHPSTLFVWPLVEFPWQPCQSHKNNSPLTLCLATCCSCRSPIVHAIQMKMGESTLHLSVAT